MNGVTGPDTMGLGYNGLDWVEGTTSTAGNYVKYTGLSGDLTVDGQVGENGAPRGVINGFVIVAVPEPSSAALLGLGGLAFFFRRRRK